MTNREQMSAQDSSSHIEDQHISLGEIFRNYFFYWPLFILGLFLCLVLVNVYLRYTEPIYKVTTTLLIKDQKKSGPSDDILSSLELFGGSKVVDNEVEILKSKMLMARVVERLGLDIKYEAEGRVIASDLYDSRSINFISIKLDSTLYGKSMSIVFPTLNTYVLEDIETGKKISGQVDQLQRNALGVYKIATKPEFSLLHKKNMNITFLDPKKVTDQALSKLSVALIKQSTVLQLDFESTVPQKGKDILNTLVRVYKEASLTDKNQTTQSTIQFIDERLKLISGELTEVEADVEGFKSSQGLTDISSEASLYLDNVKVNDAKLNETELKLVAVNDIQQYIDSNSPREKLPSTLGVDDPVLLGQINTLSQLQLERDRLLATTQEENPLVKPLTDQIETTRASIKSNINNIYVSLTNTKKTLESYNKNYEQSIKRIPGQERKFISIKRQQSIKESLYLYLLQKKEEAALSYASAVADSRVVDTAYSSNGPIKPRRSLSYLIAFMLGILLPTGYIYIKDILNNKVKGSSDISKLTTSPILGEIVYSDGPEAIVVNVNSRKAIAEQFRSIRTNMQFIHGRSNPGEGRVTLFTSSMSGEGKSFVASNIGAAFAISGRKTIILELDLRKPKVSKYLNLNNKLGISNFLIGKASIKDIIQESGINKNMYVIGSGPIPPNPSELLIQKEIEELMEYLRANFDEIIIDTPPIGLVTDAQILARLADATIYLVRHGVTFKEQIKNLNNIYLSRKFPKLNVILNGVQLGGSYGYGYGYGYGYYSDDSVNKKNGFRAIFNNFFKRF